MSTKEIVKNSAIELFACEGYDRATLSKIAEKSGIKKSSVYTHYSSKEEMFLELLTDIVINCLNHFENFIAELKAESFEAMLFKIYCEHMNYFNNNDIIAKFMLRYYFVPEKYFSNLLLEIEPIIKKNEILAQKIISIFQIGIDSGQLSRRLNSDKVYMSKYLQSFNWLCKLSIYKIATSNTNLDFDTLKLDFELYFHGITGL